jgi:hypothetical protein
MSFRRTSRISALLSLLFAVQAIHTQTIPRPVVRDSSGVRIIEYATIKTSLPAFRVAPQLLASVGGLRDDPNDEIEAKTGYETAVRFADGRIAVAENYTIRVLDSKGKFVRLLGGRGSGPGEFDRQIGKLCLIRGDSLVALSTNRRLSVFAPNGDHVRSTVTDGTPAGSCNADGSLVAGEPQPGPAAGTTNEEAATRPTRVVLRQLTREGRLADTIGVFVGGIGLGFYKVVEDAFSTALDGDRLYADNGERTEIKMYSMRTGKLQSIIRWRDPLVPITPAMFADMAGSRIPTNVSASERAKRIGEMSKQANGRPALPAYSGFFADRVGRLWVRDYWRDANGFNPGPAYTVFANDGTLLGRYDPPKLAATRRPTVTDAGADFVVIRQSGNDEGVRVVVQSIAPARTSADR